MNTAPASQRTIKPRTVPAAPLDELILETVTQVEQRVPALRGKMRTFVYHADSGDPMYALLRAAIVRIGRRTWISRAHLNEFLNSYRAAPPARGNNPNPGEHLRKRKAQKRGRR